MRELFALFHPIKRGRNISAIEFNESHLPKRLKDSKADLSSLSGTLKPVQEMVNWVSEQLARGEANPQPYHPYLVPNYHDHPWLPRANAHINALSAWKSKNRGSKKQAISFQMWLRHHFRFVISAEICNAWSPFVVLVAQMNHIAVILSIASIENSAFAIRYHDLLIASLADFARARFPFDYHSALSEIHEDTRRLAMRDNANTTAPRFTAPNPADNQPRQFTHKSRPKGQKGTQKGKGTKGKKGGKRNNAHDQPTGKGKGQPSLTPNANQVTPQA